MRLILSKEEARVLRQTIGHELNDNSYCQGVVRDASIRERLSREREVLNGLLSKLSENE